MHVGEPFVFQIGTRLFTTDAARAVHDNVRFFLRLQHVFDQCNLLSECLHIWTNRALEMSDFTLIGISHVHENGVLLVREVIELLRLEMGATIGHVKRPVLKAVGDDLVLHANNQFEEALPLLDRNVEPQFRQPAKCLHVGFEVSQASRGHRNLCVDAFVGHIRAPQHLHF